MTHAAHRPAQETAEYLKSLDCIHCGLCVEHCPTYRQLGRESTNPRGRVYLMRAVMEERAEPTPDLIEDLDLCLVCRACESACPSGVRFGEVMAATRQKLRKRGFFRRRMMDVVLDGRRLRRMAGMMRLWQRSGLRVLRHLLPSRLKRMEAYMPAIPSADDRRPLPRRVPADGESKGKVALFEGCVMSVLFQDVNRDTMRLLQAAGYEVVVPEAQSCCGALHEHDGDLDTAHRQLESNIHAFSDIRNDDVDAAIVLNSAGCAAALCGADHALPDGKGEAFASRITDLTRFLVDHGERLAFASYPDPVTYDAPCHLHHAQRETTAPMQLLARVPDLNLVPMDLWDHCCGAAGIYNLDHPELSGRILDEKLDALERSGARVLLSGNPGCLMQWRHGVRDRGLDVEVLHPATFLAAQLA